MVDKPDMSSVEMRVVAINTLARVIDKIFNSHTDKENDEDMPETGFVLMVFDMKKAKGTLLSVSNVIDNLDEVMDLLKLVKEQRELQNKPVQGTA